MKSLIYDATTSTTTLVDVIDIPDVAPAPPHPSDSERISELEAEVTDLKLQLLGV